MRRVKDKDRNKRGHTKNVGSDSDKSLKPGKWEVAREEASRPITVQGQMSLIIKRKSEFSSVRGNSAELQSCSCSIYTY